MNTNVLVAQSGGPSPVINASLAGVIDRCRAYPDRFGRILAGAHGIEGILQEQLIDIDEEDPEEIERLRQTPGAGAIGSCRYKLSDSNDEDLSRIVDVIRAHEIGYFFYIGGNDSMDTAWRVANLAHERGLDLCVLGVPKTIDNDVGDDAFDLVDHTPGYGSTARYWAMITQIIDQENLSMASSEPVHVVQAMGRRAGFIPAAARLADPERRIPLQIYTAESGHTLDSLADHVADEVRRSGRCIAVVSEGFDLGEAATEIEAVRDSFGHVEYGAARTTPMQVVVNHLNRVRLPARGHAFGAVPGVLQRSTSLFASPRDREEAWEVGAHAVELAVAGRSGVMATLRRRGGGLAAARNPYEMVLGEVQLPEVANFHRTLPPHWLSADGLDVTDDFIAYAQPLIRGGWAEVEFEDERGTLRFAQFKRVPVKPALPRYIPMNHR